MNDNFLNCFSGQANLLHQRPREKLRKELNLSFLKMPWPARKKKRFSFNHSRSTLKVELPSDRWWSETTTQWIVSTWQSLSKSFWHTLWKTSLRTGHRRRKKWRGIWRNKWTDGRRVNLLKTRSSCWSTDYSLINCLRPSFKTFRRSVASIRPTGLRFWKRSISTSYSVWIEIYSSWTASLKRFKRRWKIRTSSDSIC